MLPPTHTHPHIRTRTDSVLRMVSNTSPPNTICGTVQAPAAAAAAGRTTSLRVHPRRPDTPTRRSSLHSHTAARQRSTAWGCERERSGPRGAGTAVVAVGRTLGSRIGRHRPGQGAELLHLLLLCQLEDDEPAAGAFLRSPHATPA